MKERKTQSDNGVRGKREKFKAPSNNGMREKKREKLKAPSDNGVRGKRELCYESFYENGRILSFMRNNEQIVLSM
jgi:hypothetical protein